MEILITTPMASTLAPRVVIPPIPRKRNCKSRHKKATATPVNGPSRIATNGIRKKCMGTPKGEGMDKEDTATVTAAKIPVLIISLSFCSLLDILKA